MVQVLLPRLLIILFFPYIVHELIGKLEELVPFQKPNPKALPQPSAYAMDKYKLKECRIALKDVKEQAEVVYPKALEVYNTEKALRIRFKQRKLLHYLKTVADRQKYGRDPTKRGRWGDSDDSEYSDDEYDSREKKRRVEYEDLSRLSKEQYGFK